MITRLALLLPLAAALVGAASTARAQDIQPLDGYQRTVYRELRRYEAEFDFDNPTHHVWVGSLSDDQSQSVTVQLEAGTTYAILGVCDEDCSDVDLSLYAGSTLIDSDVALDDYPIVRVTTGQGGVYRIEISMATCTVNPCRVGIGVYEN